MPSARPSSSLAITSTKRHGLSMESLHDMGCHRRPYVRLAEARRHQGIHETASDEVEGHFLGPMPVQKFLESFLGSKKEHSTDKNVFKDCNSTSIHATHNAFAKAISKMMPSLLVCNTHNGIDATGQLAPGLSFYPKHSTTVRHGGDSAEMELFAEIKSMDLFDPFNDEGSEKGASFEAEEGLALRGKMVVTAAAIMDLQFRTHLFSFAIFGQYARLFRWDASGIIVTERFKYNESNALADFLRSFDGLSDTDRGRDPTACRIQDAWPTEIAPSPILQRLVDENCAFDDEPNDKRRRQRGSHRYFTSTKIPDRAHPAKETDFLVSWPLHYKRRSPLGRKTRPMFAFNLTSRSLVFVKQYWRAVEENSTKEGDVYFALEGKGVRNLPVIGMANDLRDISTRSQDFIAEQWAHPTISISKHHLYRMSFETIGEPLTEFRSTRELVTVIADAMICHDDAFFNANILHCDISVGNIMINPQTRRGMLMDWDLCMKVDETGHIPSGATRRGTWQFMSGRILHRLTYTHSVLDDRESFMWVLLWMMLLYTPHDRVNNLPALLDIFNEVGERYYPDPPAGGIGKHMFLIYNDYFDNIKFQNGQMLVDLIASLVPYFYAGYAGCDMDEKQRAQHLACVSENGWLVQMFHDVLARGPWPSSDAAKLNEKTTRKRGSEEARLDTEAPCAKVRKIKKQDYIRTNSVPWNLAKEAPLPLDRGLGQSWQILRHNRALRLQGLHQ